MFKLLLVDDEPAQLDGLSVNIEWDRYGVDTPYRALSAEEALRTMRELRVDIVLTDIRMPGMSGTELARIVFEKYPHAKTIFVTGYNEFQYAQQGMEYGVCGYITKPCEYADVIVAVQKAIRAIEEELFMLSRLDELNALYEQARPVIVEKHLCDWIVKRRCKPDFSDSAFSKTQLAEARFGLLIMANLYPLDAGCDERALSLARLSIPQKLVEEALAGIACVAFTDPADRIVMIALADTREGPDAAATCLEKAAELVQRAFELSFKVGMTLIWDEQAVNVEELPSRYAFLTAFAGRRFIWDSGLSMSVTASMGESPGMPAAWSHPGETVREMRFELARKAAKESLRLNPMRAYFEISGAVLDLLFDSGRSLEKDLNELARGYMGYGAFSNVGELETWLIMIITRCEELLIAENQRESNLLVEEAKRVIHEDSNYELSAGDVARRLHVHPNYLSRIFRQSTDMTLISYIIERRMEVAKALLSNGNRRVFEAALKLGYESASHFNAIFKRTTGMTPKQYQLSLLSERRLDKNNDT